MARGRLKGMQPWLCCGGFFQWRCFGCVLICASFLLSSASQDADMTAEQAALAEVVSPPAAQAESAARRALGPYRFDSCAPMTLLLAPGRARRWIRATSASRRPPLCFVLCRRLEVSLSLQGKP